MGEFQSHRTSQVIISTKEASEQGIWGIYEESEYISSVLELILNEWPLITTVRMSLNSVKERNIVTH